VIADGQKGKAVCPEIRNCRTRHAGEQQTTMPHPTRGRFAYQQAGPFLTLLAHPDCLEKSHTNPKRERGQQSAIAPTRSQPELRYCSEALKPARRYTRSQRPGFSLKAGLQRGLIATERNGYYGGQGIGGPRGDQFLIRRNFARILSPLPQPPAPPRSWLWRAFLVGQPGPSAAPVR
jgi:hypothetical protein